MYMLSCWLSNPQALLDLDLSWNRIKKSAAAFVSLKVHSVNLAHNPIGHGAPMFAANKQKQEEERRLLLRSVCLC